jgi:hypothetical protein
MEQVMKFFSFLIFCAFAFVLGAEFLSAEPVKIPKVGDEEADGYSGLRLGS